MKTKTVSKEVRGFLLNMADDIAEDLKNENPHTVEYKATKELITTLRRAAADYRYKKAMPKTRKETS